MDWTQIIVALISSGALVGVFTLVERKSALMLQNASALAESYKKLADEYEEREARTQELLQKKEEELFNQIKMNSSLRHSLDDAHTEVAVAKLMYCRDSKCPHRDPPFGTHADTIVSKTKECARKVYDKQD